MLKRGPNIPDTSGPQSVRVFKTAKSIIEVIEYRHAVAEMTRACFTDAIAVGGQRLILGGAAAPLSAIDAMLDQPRYQWFYFEQFQKRFALSVDEADGEWVLDGAPVAQRPDDEDSEGVEGGPSNGPTDGPIYSFSGGFHLPPPQKRHAPPPRRGRRHVPAGPVDQGRTAPTRPDAVAAAKRATRRLLCKTRAWLRTKPLTPRFGHIVHKFEASLAEMKEVARLTRFTAHVLATVLRRWLRRGVVELRAFLTDFDHAAYHVPTQLEAKSFELRQGFTLVLYSFDNIPWKSGLFGDLEHPNWESWLFGRLVEDERLSA